MVRCNRHAIVVYDGAGGLRESSRRPVTAALSNRGNTWVRICGELLAPASSHWGGAGGDVIAMNLHSSSPRLMTAGIISALIGILPGRQSSRLSRNGARARRPINRCSGDGVTPYRSRPAHIRCRVGSRCRGSGTDGAGRAPVGSRSALATTVSRDNPRRLPHVEFF